MSEIEKVRTSSQVHEMLARFQPTSATIFNRRQQPYIALMLPYLAWEDTLAGNPRPKVFQGIFPWRSASITLWLTVLIPILIGSLHSFLVNWAIA